MLRPRRIGPALWLAPVLTLTLVLALLAGAAAAADWVPVLFVNDGDTITVRLHGRKELVRLLGVDAPESGHSLKLRRAARQAGRTPQEEARLGQMARGFVLELLPRGSRVRLEGDARAGERDRYGRLLAYVYLQNGQLLNALLLQEGQARVYGACHCARLGQFKIWEAQARAQGRGLWPLGGP